MRIHLRDVQVAKIHVMAAAGLEEMILYNLERFERFRVPALQEQQIRLVVAGLHEQLLHVQS